MITISEIKTTRINERRQLIEDLKAQLESDPSVQAATIGGSIDRGEDDWLSDIDLYVVMDDDSIAEAVANRHSFVSSSVTPSLSMDMMKNAPTNGAYLLVHYPGEFGPQHVDWYWQPQSGANRPDDGLLLFDRANLPEISGSEWAELMNQTGGGVAIESTGPIDLANHGIEFFWSMALIISKYIVRGDLDAVEYMLNMIARTLAQIAEHLGTDIQSPSNEPYRFTKDSSKQTQFETLREVTAVARFAEGEMGLRGATVPARAIEQIEVFFDTCEQVVMQSDGVEK